MPVYYEEPYYITDIRHSDTVRTVVLPDVVLAEDPVVPELLKRIARCESGDKHFKEDGKVIQGRINPQDIGRYQINLKYHGDRAKSLEIDLWSEKGNEEYALLLYREQGTKPWYLSKGCWSR